MGTRLADRLAAARRRFFVGREAEKTLFRTALTAVEPPFFVLYLYGPGGVGKTSLLREFVGLAETALAQAVYLDARHIEASPDAFLAALALALGLTPPADPLVALLASEKRSVIFVDTYEILAALDPWLRELFLPQLPANTFFVLAGRTPPAAGWRADPGWQSLLCVLPLRNLTPAESQAYLQARAIAADAQAVITQFTHGHPLAISLVADVLEQNPDLHFTAAPTPDLVRALLERFVQETPGPAHRFALEASALVRQLTEGLLAAMLDLPDVHEIFNWLRDLSFMEAGRQGLFPHDLVREALVADLRWRNPEWYAELHSRARTYYMARLEQTQGPSQRRVLLDFVYLHRDNFLLRPYFDTFFEGNDLPTLWIDHMGPGDQPEVLALVRRFEGEEGARLAAHWFNRQPQATLVVRDHQQGVQGILTILNLHEATPADLAVDPATGAAWAYLRRHGPLRPGELCIYFRFWLDREVYQELSLVQSRLFLVCLQYYLTTPGLAFSFFACVDPDFWEPIFTYAELSRLSEADFVVNGRTYGVYGHDWRLMSPAHWLALMAERELALGIQDAPSTAPSAAAVPLLVLSQPDFADAVRTALRVYTRPQELQSSPLLRSRLIVERATTDTPQDQAIALQKLLKAAVDRLQASPRQTKLYRALYHTYIRPAATQELAAELLDLPFSTYRRHLKAGVDDVVEYLWNQELAGPIG
jgi:hypothetical protein